MCITEFNYLKFEFLPNVSDDYISAFSIVHRIDRLKKHKALKFVYYWLFLRGWFLKVHFIDGSDFYYKINKKNISSLKTFVGCANLYLQNIKHSNLYVYIQSYNLY